MFIETQLNTRRLREGDTIKLVAGGLMRVIKIARIEEAPGVPVSALTTFTIHCVDDV